jgi:hypothetical protein
MINLERVDPQNQNLYLYTLLLLTTYCLLFTSYFLLLITYYLLLTVHRSSPTLALRTSLFRPNSAAVLSRGCPEDEYIGPYSSLLKRGFLTGAGL